MLVSAVVMGAQAMCGGLNSNIKSGVGGEGGGGGKEYRRRAPRPSPRPPIPSSAPINKNLHLTTACTVVKSRGLFRTNDVKINSKRVNLTFFDPFVFGLGTLVITYRP